MHRAKPSQRSKRIGINIMATLELAEIKDLIENPLKPEEAQLHENDQDKIIFERYKNVIERLQKYIEINHTEAIKLRDQLYQIIFNKTVSNKPISVVPESEWGILNKKKTQTEIQLTLLESEVRLALLKLFPNQKKAVYQVELNMAYLRNALYASRLSPVVLMAEEKVETEQSHGPTEPYLLPKGSFIRQTTSFDNLLAMKVDESDVVRWWSDDETQSDPGPSQSPAISLTRAKTV